MNFARATLLYKSIGVLPYKLELGFSACIFFDWRKHEEKCGPPELKIKGAKTIKEYA